MKLNIGLKVLLSLLVVAFIAVAASSVIAILQAQKALKETTLRGFEELATEVFFTIRRSVLSGIESARIVADDPVIHSKKELDVAKGRKTEATEDNYQGL